MALSTSILEAAQAALEPGLEKVQNTVSMLNEPTTQTVAPETTTPTTPTPTTTQPTSIPPEQITAPAPTVGTGMLEKPSDVTTAPTLKPSTSYITPEASVANQLASILQAGSPLQSLAEARSKEEAQRKGLLSSSLAVGAGQRALIENALPIAQQTAQLYGQAGLNQQEKEAQLAQTGYEADITAGLIGTQAVVDTATQIRELAFKDKQLAADVALKSRQLEGGDKAKFVEAIGPLTDGYNKSIATIQTVPTEQLSTDLKNVFINDLKNQYQNQVDLLASVYEADVQWDLSTPSTSAPTTPVAQPSTPVATQPVVSQPTVGKGNLTQAEYDKLNSYQKFRYDLTGSI